jgi:hypothetical protein
LRVRNAFKAMTTVAHYDAPAVGITFFHHTFDKVGVSDECRNEGRLRSFVNILRAAQLDDLSTIHHCYTVGQDDRFSLIVRHKDKRASGLSMDSLEFLMHLEAKLQVKRPER